MKNNKIKKLEELSQLINTNGEVLNEFVTYQQVFDESGKTILDAAWETSGILQNKSTYTYDENGNQIAQKVYLDEENISEHWTYAFDEQGKLIQKKVEYADGSISIYNKKIEPNNIVEWIITDEDNEFEGKEIRKYNSKDALIDSIDIDDENDEILRKIFEYDDKGNMLTQTIFEYGEPLSKEVMQYDENSNLINSLRLSPGGGKISESKFHYNEDNKLSRRDINGEIQVDHSYDEKGNEIEVKQTDLQNNLNTGLVQSKYNEEGILVEKFVYEMGAQYNIEPGVVSRNPAIHQKVVMKYEYF